MPGIRERPPDLQHEDFLAPVDEVRFGNAGRSAFGSTATFRATLYFPPRVT